MEKDTICIEEKKQNKKQKRREEKEARQQRRKEKKKIRKEKRRNRRKYIVLFIVPAIVAIIVSILIGDIGTIYSLSTDVPIEEDYATMKEYAVKMAKEYDFDIIEDKSIIFIDKEFQDNRLFITLQNYRCKLSADFPITTETTIGRDGETKLVITIQYDSPNFEEVEIINLGDEIALIILIFLFFYLITFLITLVYTTYKFKF